MRSLQEQPSALCQRCAEYDVARVFAEAEPLDRVQRQAPDWSSADHASYYRAKERYELALGPLASLVLVPSCPLCRLIFRILPREGLCPTDDSLKIVPFRSYVQHPGWEKVVPAYKAEAAILLGVDHTGNAVSFASLGSGMGADTDLRRSEMAGESVALATDDASPGRKVGNARLLSPYLDYTLPRKALETCLREHATTCRVGSPRELLDTRMIDVVNRKTVSCPEQCDYIALSYVWGGVMPAEGALEAGTLPQTIEDAITVTRHLGRRYLWVCLVFRFPQGDEKRAKHAVILAVSNVRAYR